MKNNYFLNHNRNNSYVDEQKNLLSQVMQGTSNNGQRINHIEKKKS